MSLQHGLTADTPAPTTIIVDRFMGEPDGARLGGSLSRIIGVEELLNDRFRIARDAVRADEHRQWEVVQPYRTTAVVSSACEGLVGAHAAGVIASCGHRQERARRSRGLAVFVVSPACVIDHVVAVPHR